MNKSSLNLKSKDREFLINLTKTGNRISREFERAYILLALGRDIEARQMFLEEKACGQFLEFLSDNDEESE